MCLHKKENAPLWDNVNVGQGIKIIYFKEYITQMQIKETPTPISKYFGIL